MLLEQLDSTPLPVAVEGAHNFAPFDVVLVLQGARPERASLLLELYEPIFRQVFFFTWGYVQTDVPYPARAQVFRCRGPAQRRFFYHAKCLPQLLNRSATISPSVRGAFVMHMDFWFRPSMLLHAAGLDRVWQLGRSFRPPREPRPLDQGPVCFRQGESDADKWHWLSDSRERGHAAAARAAQSVGGRIVGAIPVCRGWSDFFYLPRSVWKEFVTMATIFRNVFHEVAIPTVMHILVRYLGHLEREKLQCWGGPHDELDDTALLRAYTCGHKVKLHNQSHRDALRSLMQRETFGMKELCAK